MVMFGPIFSALIFMSVLTFLFCMLTFLWWVGKRGYSF